jgi:ParB family chromosome partitioning protein
MSDDTKTKSEFTIDKGWVSRPFGRDVLYTRRLEKVPHGELVPDPEQPRQGRWESSQLERQIVEAGGVFEPLLVEPIGDGSGAKYKIIDGHRRWTNTGRILKDLEAKRKKADTEEAWQTEYDKYNLLNVEVTSRPLTLHERLRIWVHIHRQRKEWDLKEKERTAYRLLEVMSQAEAAMTLGVSVKELMKLVTIYEFSEKLTGVLSSPDAAITWGREIVSLAEKYRSDELVDLVKEKIGDNLMVNSKEVRGLRDLVKNPEALKKFKEHPITMKEALEEVPGAKNPVPDFSPTGSSSGSAAISSSNGYGSGLAHDLDSFNAELSRYSWTDLVALKKDSHFVAAVAEAKRRISELDDVIKA